MSPLSKETGRLSRYHVPISIKKNESLVTKCSDRWEAKKELEYAARSDKKISPMKKELTQWQRNFGAVVTVRHCDNGGQWWVAVGGHRGSHGPCALPMEVRSQAVITQYSLVRSTPRAANCNPKASNRGELHSGSRAWRASSTDAGS